MKAMVYHRYGPPDVLEPAETTQPVVEGDQVLIKVHAASVNWLDWHFLTGKPFMARIMAGGLLRPKRKILGVDLAGRVEAVGRNVRQFQPGDQVFGGCAKGGAFAEYACAREHEVQPKPAHIGFAEAAAVGAAASTALHGLRDAGHIRSGQRVLINGASGGVGTFAVQIAKAFGAEVTGVCSTRNLEMVRSIGADQVIDYSREDFTQNGQRYDLIFDVAAKLTFTDCRRVLAPEGIYVTTAFSPVLVLAGLWASTTSDRKLVPLAPKPPSKSDQVFLRDLLEKGKVTPVIDRRYALRELAEALRYLSKGHARGKVVITIE